MQQLNVRDVLYNAITIKHTHYK